MPLVPPGFPWMLRHNGTSTGLGLTKDFRTWIRIGRITNPLTDDLDVLLFPEKVKGKYLMLHRPLSWVDPQFGTDLPAIWISTWDDLLHWDSSQLSAKMVEPTSTLPGQPVPWPNC